MNKLILMTAASAAMLSASFAVAQRQRLPAECRQEIAALCRGAEDGLRQCVVRSMPKLSDSCRDAIGSRQTAPPDGAREHAYGNDPAQKLDLVVPAGVGKRPLLLFIHGGGWSIGDKRHAAALKADHFTGEGWAFGSVNYRLVPHGTVEQQASDVAAAVAWLRAHSAELGLDPDRIVLMGHSAGAHLAALVGTDPRYFAAADVPLGEIGGVILLDGAGYDVARQMADDGNRAAARYEAAFGTDPARQRALSPTLHAAAPNAANWLILPIERRADSMAQSNALAAGLTAAGAEVRVVPVPNSSHRKLNRGLGSDGDFATSQVDAFLSALR